MSGEDGDTKEDIVIHVPNLRTIELKLKVQLVISNNSDAIKHDTARTARFSKKSLGSDVGEIKKMSEKLKKKSVLTPRNVREKSNTVIYYKTPTKHRH